MVPCTYLLTGVAGFVGRHTAELLLAAGHRVVGIDNLNDYYAPAIKEQRVRTLADHPRFVYRTVDIEDREAVNDLFERERFDAVVNLAARAGVRYSQENPQVYVTTNVLGLVHLLEGMRARGVPKLVLASTSSLYAGQPMPFVETLAVNEPISPYAATKKAAEAMAYTYHYLYGIDVSVVRYFTVYGPWGRPDMSVLRFVHRIEAGLPLEVYGDGLQARDFTYVDDIARGTVAALRPLGYEVINLGGGQNPVSLVALVEALEEVCGRKAVIDTQPSHPADMRDTWADIAKAARLLGWTPEVPLLEGLRRTVAWYRASRPWLAPLLDDR